MMDYKKALEESNGDFDKAIDVKRSFTEDTATSELKEATMLPFGAIAL